MTSTDAHPYALEGRSVEELAQLLRQAWAEATVLRDEKAAAEAELSGALVREQAMREIADDRGRQIQTLLPIIAAARAYVEWQSRAKETEGQTEFITDRVALGVRQSFDALVKALEGGDS